MDAMIFKDSRNLGKKTRERKKVNKKNKKAVSILTMLLFFALLLFCIFVIISLEKKHAKLEKLQQYTKELETKNAELENKVKSLSQEIENLSELFHNLSRAKQPVNITWNELRTFLKIDKTNELVYSKENFDCTGFALALFKNTRNVGIFSGIVEIEFLNESVGHMLNVFAIKPIKPETVRTGKETIYIDVTGDENGEGKDKIAYIKINKPYGTIVLDKAKEEIYDCQGSCNMLINEDALHLVKTDDIFSYSYFEKQWECKEFFDRCVNEYNDEVEKFNKKNSRYSYEEMLTWQKNLEKLGKYITIGNVYIVSKGNVVKNMNEYW